MALDPLAEATDLPDVWQTVDYTDRALAIASSAIREAAGAPISAVTATISVTAPSGRLLTLPSPLTAVTSVTLDGAAVTDYEVLPNGLWRRCGWGCSPVPVVVACTFGLTEVPEDIVDLAARLAVAWLADQAAGGGSTAGLKSVKLDDAAEAYSDESAGQVSPVFIPEVTRNWLARRFGGGVEVVSTL